MNILFSCSQMYGDPNALWNIWSIISYLLGSGNTLIRVKYHVNKRMCPHTRRDEGVNTTPIRKQECNKRSLNKLKPVENGVRTKTVLNAKGCFGEEGKNQFSVLSLHSNHIMQSGQTSENLIKAFQAITSKTNCLRRRKTFHHWQSL